MATRIIAKLDVKPPFVVKPVHFEGLRKISTPSELSKKYYNQGVDELFYIDIVASLYQREILVEGIKNTADQLFIPFAVGGGVRSIEDCSKLFHNGADKIVINTHAVQNDPSLIDAAAKIFGSQAVCVNIEAKRWGEDWECFTDCGRISSNRNVLDWVKEVESRGAGEILVQSVDRDGRQRGFDLELAQSVVESVSIPTVVGSGAGSLDDILHLAQKAKPSGIAVSSVLHYEKCNITQIKEYLNKHGVEVSK